MNEPDARARDKAQRARDRARIFGEPPTDLFSYLAEHDARCPSCGYGLRGLRDARCPECAMPLDRDLLTRPPSLPGDIEGYVHGGSDQIEHPLARAAILIALVAVGFAGMIFAYVWTR